MGSPCQMTTTVLLDLVGLLPVLGVLFLASTTTTKVPNFRTLEADRRLSPFEFPSRPVLKVSQGCKIGLLPVRGLRGPKDYFSLPFLTSPTA